MKGSLGNFTFGPASLNVPAMGPDRTDMDLSVPKELFSGPINQLTPVNIWEGYYKYQRVFSQMGVGEHTHNTDRGDKYLVNTEVEELGRGAISVKNCFSKGSKIVKEILMGAKMEAAVPPYLSAQMMYEMPDPKVRIYQRSEMPFIETGTANAVGKRGLGGIAMAFGKEFIERAIGMASIGGNATLTELTAGLEKFTPMTAFYIMSLIAEELYVGADMPVYFSIWNYAEKGLITRSMGDEGGRILAHDQKYGGLKTPGGIDLNIFQPNNTYRFSIEREGLTFRPQEGFSRGEPGIYVNFVAPGGYYSNVFGVNETDCPIIEISHAMTLGKNGNEPMARFIEYLLNVAGMIDKDLPLVRA